MLKRMACCPQHEHIVLPCGGDFQRTLDMFLPAHFGEIYRIRGRRLRSEIVRGAIRRNRLKVLKVRDERKQTFNRKDFGCHQQSDGDRQIVAQASRFHASGGNLVGTWTRIAAGPTSGH